MVLCHSEAMNLELLYLWYSDTMRRDVGISRRPAYRYCPNRNDEKLCTTPWRKT